MELREAPLAGQLPGDAVPDAVVEQAEVPGLRAVRAVPDPVGRDEAHHVHDGEDHRRDRPQDPDRTGVAHVVCLVDLGSLGGWDHGGGHPGDHGAG